jgi:GNAT superfamily N-acetyltransferase
MERRFYKGDHMSYDPLHIDTEPTCGVFSACYDPEGPVGHGESREAAVGALLAIIDSEHESSMLAGSIVALVDALAEANACERDNFRRAEHNLARAEAAERDNAALREAATEAIAALGKALHAYPDTRAMGHAKAMLEAALGSVPARGDSVAEPQQISASDEPSPAAYYPWGIDTPQPGGTAK